MTTALGIPTLTTLKPMGGAPDPKAISRSGVRPLPSGMTTWQGEEAFHTFSVRSLANPGFDL